MGIFFIFFYFLFFSSLTEGSDSCTIGPGVAFLQVRLDVSHAGAHYFRCVGCVCLRGHGSHGVDISVDPRTSNHVLATSGCQEPILDILRVVCGLYVGCLWLDVL